MDSQIDMGPLYKEHHHQQTGSLPNHNFGFITFAVMARFVFTHILHSVSLLCWLAASTN